MSYSTKNPLEMKGSLVRIQGKEGFMLEGTHATLYPMYKHIHENHKELYLYDLRHSETDWSRPFLLQEGGSILVNYFGIVIMREPIKFAKNKIFYWQLARNSCGIAGERILASRADGQIPAQALTRWLVLTKPHFSLSHFVYK